MYLKSILKEEWLYNVEDAVKEFGKVYTSAIMLLSEAGKRKIDYSLAFELAKKKFEESYTCEIKCTIEAEKALDTLRYIGGKKEKPPTGWENFVKKYENDSEAVRLGEIINKLEKEKIKFEQSNVVIAS